MVRKGHIGSFWNAVISCLPSWRVVRGMLALQLLVKLFILSMLGTYVLFHNFLEKKKINVLIVSLIVS